MRVPVWVNIKKPERLVTGWLQAAHTPIFTGTGEASWMPPRTRCSAPCSASSSTSRWTVIIETEYFSAISRSETIPSLASMSRICFLRQMGDCMAAPRLSLLNDIYNIIVSQILKKGSFGWVSHLVFTTLPHRGGMGVQIFPEAPYN